MANKHSPSELNELSSESEVSGSGSGSDSDWDDSEVDPDYEETHIKFSNLSLRNKAKARVVKGAETEPEVPEITTPDLDDANFEKIIKVGLLEKLKVEECKFYLRKNGLRLTGNKDVLIQRIREHQEIINGGGEKKYPPSSFVLNCKGDACTDDVVLFEQNVYEMFNIASRSASGPSCGKRIVAGRIVKESYGAAKQQHTFTIEVLWSKGEKPFSPLHPLLIKGRNLYRLKTLRQKWEDEGKRQKMLMEKHSRGSIARADREARIQKKEKRKTIMKNRVTDKDSVRHQHQPYSSRPTSHCQPQETDTSTNPEKPAFQSRNSASSAIGTGKEMSSAIANTSAAVTEQRDIPFGSKTVVVGSDQLGKKPIDSGKTSFNVHRLHDQQQAWKRSAYCGSTNFDIDLIRKAELSANYNFPDFHYREKQTAIGKHDHHLLGEYPLIEEKRNFLSSPKPNYIHYQQAWKRSTDCGSTFNTFNNDHAFNAESNRLTERTQHRKPLTRANHFLPSMNNGQNYGENYKKRQICRYYARGMCYFGDMCKFSHDFE